MTRPKGGRPSGRSGSSGTGPGRATGRRDGGGGGDSGGGGGGKARFIKDVACGMAIPRALARGVLVVAQLASIELQIRRAR